MTIEAVFSLAAIIVALVGLDLYLLGCWFRAKRRDRATPRTKSKHDLGSSGGCR